MNKSERRYKELQQKAEQLRTQRDQAAGALKQTKKKLEEDFGVTSLKQAKRLLKKLNREAEVAENEFAKLLEAYEETLNG